ncbi:hypothetical protein H5392_02240 [Tessaracoccus sp. MC1865]|uniref:hypothetical protein n=1 Tax=Tessaracoccus sp. MC1865 TaxID=2760310 RepID=UPI0016011E2B|nr:hypothetical protein [Tessaracoccus sp. MC1865]MBB1482679.1 hypothetical protein [Tessaracoccus sp. MC1865]QTO37872.1 hypothetical protein J7D54_01850 [Tessaracoccus sp. MC1865]
MATIEPTDPPVADEEVVVDEEFLRSMEDDEEAQKILQLMSEKVCDYCEAPVTWLDPTDLRAADPQSFDELVDRYGIDPEAILMCWDCPECGNFSLMGDDFEVQWLDATPQCPECDSYQVEVIDPARVAHLDRARYLEWKKQVGVQALLDGDAVQCHDCGVLSFVPRQDAEGN